MNNLIFFDLDNTFYNYKNTHEFAINEVYKNQKIYDSFENLINSINLDYWIFIYIFFEINLIKELGYDTNLTEHSKNVKGEKELIKIKIDGYIYEIPSYLIYKKVPDNFTNTIIRKSLYFTRQMMLNKFFIPNNLLFPKSRIILENYFH